ncbi:hypothetical protein Kisp01_69680 [Kineosporia sp. NBRC 101677]|uniref:DUF397 domain-containing protein n=1 Tax=Kineosporia sp. NBRC 101677 TaxID=3032197 RepID=UPI0024A12846|nr:DUF397 domain-containing protein [Kineosporia sp. NBRC 101677]GLY19954.1 hypothetical protein Kisp01_69680 [Kineosporia sp. NBRC 101677]
MNGDTQWQKATKSGQNGDCVEARRQNGQIQIRDSKNPNGPILTFTQAEFAAWIEGAARGEFNHLAS